MNQTRRKRFAATRRGAHQQAMDFAARKSPLPHLLSVTAQVRHVELTPLGHVSVVLDTSAGRLKAFSDAAGVHLSELRCASRAQVVLLRLHRAKPDAVRHWQLLCCRALPEDARAVQPATLEGAEQ